MRKTVWRKKLEIEKRLGMSIGEYADIRGISQSDLARELGVTNMTMGKWIAADKRVQRYSYPLEAA